MLLLGPQVNVHVVLRSCQMNAASSVVLDAAISALVASRQRRRYDDEENDDYYYSDTSSGRRRRGRRRPRRATVRTAAAAAESSIAAFCQTLLSLIKQIVYVSFVSTVILTLSVLTYGFIYNLSMPRLAYRSPIYFDYNFVPERHLSGAYGRYIEKQGGQFCNSETVGNGSSSEEKARQCSHLKRDTGPAPPTAVVELNMQHTQWHAYHEQVLPFTHEAGLEVHMITPKRRHFVDLALLLPESNLNRRLGMMMVEVDLLASDGTLLASSGRPTMLPHESALIGVARKIVLMGPILIGAVAEARMVVLESFDSYVESPELPLAAIVVRLVVPRHTSIVNDESHDAYAPIQVHSGEVRIGKELNTIQGIMKGWFYSVGLAAVSFLSFFYAFWFLIIRAWFRRQMRHYRSTNVRTAESDRNNQGEHDFEYDADNDNESDWESAGDNNANTNGEGDNQSMESGVNFVEMDGGSDDENWDSIHAASQNSAQGSFTCDGAEEGGDQSHGGFDAQAAGGKGNDERSPDVDLESLAEEPSPEQLREAQTFFTGLANDLSFEISELDSKSNGAEGKSPTVAAAAGRPFPRGSGTSGQRNGVDKVKAGAKTSRSKKRKCHKTKGLGSGRVKNTATKRGNLRNEAEEKLLAEKVMRGDFGPSFEVFTDLDEPDPVV
jgi:hypothetical protein